MNTSGKSASTFRLFDYEAMIKEHGEHGIFDAIEIIKCYIENFLIAKDPTLADPGKEDERRSTVALNFDIVRAVFRDYEAELSELAFNDQQPGAKIDDGSAPF
jgi:hypothetical protein